MTGNARRARVRSYDGGIGDIPCSGKAGLRDPQHPPGTCRSAPGAMGFPGNARRARVRSYDDGG
ncbi:hypothetical protein FHR61_003362 [Xanthomonas arboricola]|uniref:Uncharacterized protein n=1 Tax=Xanthomonas cannabis TaxID=1885674 RepID=A0ABR6JL81_9XANT|nr:hypothetical protein [Xanthomonas cannabis]MBB5523485.1 hypothetical protein [Xanthomonas cannabis]